MTVPPILLLLIVLTAGAAIVDWRTRHIPNWLVLTGFAGSLLNLLATMWKDFSHGGSVTNAAGHGSVSLILGAVICALVPCLLFRMGAMGGGDVKLLAVVGASLGPMLGLQVELTAFCMIALFAPVRLAFDGQLPQLLRNLSVLCTNPFRAVGRRRALPPASLISLPFGPAIFLATISVLLLERTIA